MGLDIVELVLTIEDEFQIAISDTEAEQCRTVREVVDLVYSKMRKDREEKCPSQHGFYVVRRKLMQILGVARSRVRPDTELEQLIGRRNRRALWKRILIELAGGRGDWPQLVRPTWLRLVLLVIPVLVFLVCFVLVCSWMTVVDAFVLAPWPAFLAALFFLLVTVPTKREFPESFRFVRDLVKFVKTLDSRVWSRSEVFERVKRITVRQLDVEESEVTEQADFVKDLGA